MIFNHNFLYVFFGVTFAMSLCCNANAGTMAGTIKEKLTDGSKIPISQDKIIRNEIAKTRDSTSQTRITFQLCPAGQYVSQCGNYRVGFYWLKSANLPYQDIVENTEGDGENPGDGGGEETSDDTENMDRYTIDTRDYYVGETNLELFEQMRGFFSSTGDTTIFYRDPDSGIKPVPYVTFVEERELILKNICHPALTSAIKCEKCPNGATVPESSVDLDENNLSFANSWRFHTIADCYMTEFKDSTGTYIYLPANTPDDERAIEQITATNSEHCYYTPTTTSESLNGDEIGTVVPGTISSVKGTDANVQSITPKNNFLQFLNN